MKTKLIKLKTNTEMRGLAHISPLEIKVKENTQFVLDFSYIKNIKSTKSSSNSMVTPVLFTLVFEKEGVTAEIIGIYRLYENEMLNFETSSHHKVPNTVCETNIKGVLGTNSSSNYIGKIKIDKKAQQTSSFLNNSVLVAGKNTKNESQPILEIEANDVKASHGATTGRINDMQKYYLQSRGLTFDDAKKLIIDGFFKSALAQIRDDVIRHEIEGKLL